MENFFGRAGFPSDPQPQWRCVEWSSDETLVAASNSAGSVTVWDVLGTAVCTIAGVCAYLALQFYEYFIIFCFFLSLYTPIARG